jgi:hypothetical protein
MGEVTFTLMCLALLINTPVQGAALMRRHAPAGREFGNPLAHLAKWRAALVLLVGAVPFALLAAGVLGLIAAIALEAAKGGR